MTVGTPPLEGRSIRVRGTVQGVGFRPYVFSLAQKHGIKGTVRNTGSVVEIEIEGSSESLAAFLEELQQQAPPLASIEQIDVSARELSGYDTFRIMPSVLDSGHQPVPPDIATCDDCLRELFDPADRRYRYPFINCTNCGPRFTIIEALPYDRARTTMRGFPVCEACNREYNDPADRRFHAQPIACPVCGPQVSLLVGDGNGALQEAAGDAFAAAALLLNEGQILAVKGVGGFQLACDATNSAAVLRLRQRKRRYGKPFALMVRDLEQARQLARVSEQEAELLQSRERPIVLLQRRIDAALAPGIASGLATVGLMLPCTPLHYLLLQAFQGPLVMTSGNISEEPIAIGNQEALQRLHNVADAFMLHDREICSRYDDSVLRVIAGQPLPIRRARSYAPAPLPLPFTAQQDILAFGAQQKNTFCLLQGSNAFLSQHIGELDNLSTVDHLRATLLLYRNLFGAQPRVLAHDLHPDYLSTQLAMEASGGVLPRVAVQHHHAHVVSCMAEHQLAGPVIGVACDGTGYGTDGAVWGGEVMTATWSDWQRRAHLQYVPLLGAEAAVREPLRMLASHLWSSHPDAEHVFADVFARLSVQQRRVWRQQYQGGFNAPFTSSCGRLFDAVAALLGVCSEAHYEGEPAARLEAVADPHVRDVLPFQIRQEADCLVVDPAATWAALHFALHSGASVPELAALFHNTVAAFLTRLCVEVRIQAGINQVCLSGGCFQNALLTERTVSALMQEGFEVFTHTRVPPNDGGISLGQAVVAAARIGS